MFSSLIFNKEVSIALKIVTVCFLLWKVQLVGENVNFFINPVVNVHGLS